MEIHGSFLYNMITRTKDHLGIGGVITTTTEATIEKLDALQASDYSMVMDLIDHLSMAGPHTDDEALFMEIRECTSANPMTEDEVAEEVEAARREFVIE